MRLLISEQWGAGMRQEGAMGRFATARFGRRWTETERGQAIGYAIIALMFVLYISFIACGIVEHTRMMDQRATTWVGRP